MHASRRIAVNFVNITYFKYSDKMLHKPYFHVTKHIRFQEIVEFTTRINESSNIMWYSHF